MSPRSRSVKVKIVWKGGNFIRKFRAQHKAAMHAMALATVNQMAELAHKDTGTLKNSMNYKLSDAAGSQFSTEHGDTIPPPSAKVSKPKPKESKKMRAGSALVYAAAQERHNAWASKSYDRIRKVLPKIYARVMRF